MHETELPLADSRIWDRNLRLDKKAAFEAEACVAQKLAQQAEACMLVPHVLAGKRREGHSIASLLPLT